MTGWSEKTWLRRGIKKKKKKNLEELGMEQSKKRVQQIRCL